MNDQSIKCFTSDGSERTVQDVLSKLKFISSVKEGEKIDVYSEQVVSADYWVSRLYRTLLARGESRDATLEYITKIIKDAFDLLSFYLSSSNNFFKNIGFSIAEALQESKQGLRNLSKTYTYDRMFVSKIESLIVTLNAKISDILKNYGCNIENIIENTKDIKMTTNIVNKHGISNLSTKADFLTGCVEIDKNITKHNTKGNHLPKEVSIIKNETTEYNVKEPKDAKDTLEKTGKDKNEISVNSDGKGDIYETNIYTNSYQGKNTTGISPKEGTDGNIITLTNNGVENITNKTNKTREYIAKKY